MITPGQVVQGPTAVTTQHVLAMSLDQRSSKIQPKYRTKKHRKYGVSSIIHGKILDQKVRAPFSFENLLDLKKWASLLFTHHACEKKD